MFFLATLALASLPQSAPQVAPAAPRAFSARAAQERAQERAQESARKRAQELAQEREQEREQESARKRAQERAQERVQKSAPAPGGWLGVQPGDDEQPGVPLSAIIRLTPAARAGLRPGDRILSIDGAALDAPAQLLKHVQRKAPGGEITLRIRREVALELDGATRADDGSLALGVVLPQVGDGADPAACLRISEIRARTPAQRAGLAAGDRIVALDGKKLGAHADLVAHMHTIEAPREVRVSFERKLSVRLEQPPAPAQAEVAPPPAAPRAFPGAVEPSLPRLARQRPGAGAPPPLPGVELEAELRALRADLAALREELAQLRAELRARREPREPQTR